MKQHHAEGDESQRRDSTEAEQAGVAPRTDVSEWLRGREVPTGTRGGFDYDLRPDYWDPADPVTLITGQIAGRLRRQAVEEALRGDEAIAELIREEDREDFLSDERRAQLGGIHPHLLGGEFLPRYEPGQIEIARIVMESVTQDTLSIRALRRDGRIHYSVCDEYYGYLGEDQAICPDLWTERPLTFGEMVVWVSGFESGWDDRPNHFFDSVRDTNLDGGAEAEEMWWFLGIESPYYPQLREYFSRQADEWYAWWLYGWLDLERKRV